ncbi:MAG TPA: hypothetical protein VK284_04035 [Streptosporangiaceae bacterium]|nr:hypothetical protein [Streptosporangiaceae bacterium]HLN69554.1 hypothetical protein [Streptosporangiaceae bacterium]
MIAAGLGGPSVPVQAAEQVAQCQRVKDSASPSGSTASVATIFSRVGTSISGSSSVVMAAPCCGAAARR